MRSLVAMSLLCLFAAAPAIAAPDRWCDLDLGKASRFTYTLVHKMHTVKGTSASAEGKLVCLADGTGQVMIRIPVDSFDTGNSNRDAHAAEVLEPGRFPYVVFKGVVHGLQRPVGFPAPLAGTAEGVLDFHGVKVPTKVPFSIKLESGDKARGTAHFEVSLDAHQVERPSLLFVKVDDKVAIDADLSFERRAPSVAATGK